MNENVNTPSRVRTPSDLRARVDAICTPTSPVTRRDLFAGRAHALPQLLELLQHPGRHAVIFGERAAGKTSLATIVPEFASGPVGVVRVAANVSDTFDTLWRQAAEQVRTTLRRAERGLAAATFPGDTPTTLARATSSTNEDVIAMLARLSAGAPAWIVFDDFDRVTDAETRTRMRAIAEATGAAAPNVTLVFVGSAATGDALIEPSASLMPVRVSRMNADELLEGVSRTLRLVGADAEDAVLERIVTLSNGMPQAMQSLTRTALLAAGDEGAERLTCDHLTEGVRRALDEASAAVKMAYEQATVRARRGIYPEILLACALAPHDEEGTFAVSDVCEAVTRIVRREVRGLTNQVSALTEEGRGAVLHKRGAAKTARYRFVDPNLEPYILMRGLEEGWATHHTPSWLPGLPEAMELPKAA